MTTACVLLAERGSEPETSPRFYRAKSIDELGDLDSFLDEGEFRQYGTPDLDTARKWRSLFPGGHEIDTKDSNLVPLSTYGRFSRGIATGANSFFAIRPSTAGEMGLPAHCLIPCVSKARQASDKIFTQRDFETLRQENQPVFLFDGEAASGKAIERYISSGRASGYHNRFLTKARSPWYALEKRRPGRIWVSVFGRSGIRFIWNESNCVTLTCFHVFQPSDTGKSCIGFLFLYLNSDTGRSLLELEKREYGDGLEKYEPNDINESLAPDFSLLDSRDIDRLGVLQKEYLKAEKGSKSEQAILAEADSILCGLRSRA
jgi:adenine-specific DNA-methyltransferase